MQDPSGARTCLACQTDPPPFMTCHLGRDHHVGLVDRVPGLRAADGRVHPAPVLRDAPGPRAAGIATARRSLAAPRKVPWQAGNGPGRQPGASGTGQENR